VSVGINALVKAQEELKRVTSNLPKGASVLIDTKDVAVTGGIVCGFCGLIAINALLGILFIVIPACARKDLSSRTLLFQSTNFLVMGLGLFATLVPFTLFFATHEASVLAFIGPVEIPASLVKAIEEALGVTTVYRNIPYLRLLVIFSWIAFFFTMLVTGVSFFGLYRFHASAQRTKPVDGDRDRITATDTTDNA